MNSIGLYLVMISVFLGYILYIIARYGVQSSVSQSFYVLPKNLKILFTLFCWGFVFPAIILSSNPLMFFAGAGGRYAAPDSGCVTDPGKIRVPVNQIQRSLNVSVCPCCHFT